MTYVEEFIKAVAPAAQKTMAKSAIPASFTIAQAALESNWGRSQLAKAGHNLFGVKANGGWNGPVIPMNTREFHDGQWEIVTAYWRNYWDWEACFADHADFLHQNKRYGECFTGNKNGEEFSKAVAAAGYASDPLYSSKLIQVMRQYDLSSYDLGAGNGESS